MRLTPYMYTYCEEAHQTGVPTSRAMVLEFPKDSVTWGTKTQYQFMNGEWILVAPVYKSGGRRDSIYLPEGRWFDYWDGTVYAGQRWLTNYDAPLDKLPLFIKAGGIVPMYPPMNYDGERPADTLTLDIYPFGKSSFDLYEDDGITRQYRSGAYARTRIEVNSSRSTAVRIDAKKGSYNGDFQKRFYLLMLHTKMPSAVLLNNRRIARYFSAAAFKHSVTGYYFDPGDKKGLLNIRSGFLSTSDPQDIQVLY
jgi:alpha-glucosidase